MSKKYGYDTIDGDCIIVLWYRAILFGNNEHKIFQYLISALKGNCDLSSEHLATWNMGTLQRINGTVMNTDIYCWMAFYFCLVGPNSSNNNVICARLSCKSTNVISQYIYLDNKVWPKTILNWQCYKICFYGTRRCNGKRCFYLPLKNASFWLMAFQNGRVNTCFCTDNFHREEKTNNIVPIHVENILKNVSFITRLEFSYDEHY